MELLPEDVKIRLPPIHSQDEEMLPMVYARFSLSGTPLVWYAIEGQPEGDDYLFFGYVLGPNVFRSFRLSELKTMRTDAGQRVERDVRFIPGRFTDVIPAPDL
jgi:hypothetical protein